MINYTSNPIEYPTWIFYKTKLGHSMFIAFIELRIDGSWKNRFVTGEYSKTFEVLTAENDDDCFVSIIEPDGLRRNFHFNKGSTIGIFQNILSYHPEQLHEEVTTDEKEQSGKGSSREKL